MADGGETGAQWTPEEREGYVASLGVTGPPHGAAVQAFLSDVVAETPLPAEWMGTRDTHGRLFFANTLQQESSWTYPLESAVMEMASIFRDLLPLSAADRDSKIRKLHAELTAEAEVECAKWRSVQQDDGSEYYFHAETMETKWQNPTEFIFPPYQLKLGGLGKLIDEAYVQRLTRIEAAQSGSRAGGAASDRAATPDDSRLGTASSSRSTGSSKKSPELALAAKKATLGRDAGLPAQQWMQPRQYARDLGLNLGEAGGVDTAIFDIVERIFQLELPQPWIVNYEGDKVVFVHTGYEPAKSSKDHPLKQLHLDIIQALRPTPSGGKLNTAEMKQMLAGLAKRMGSHRGLSHFGRWEAVQLDSGGTVVTKYEDRKKGRRRSDDPKLAAASQVGMSLTALKIVWEYATEEAFPFSEDEIWSIAAQAGLTVIQEARPQTASSIDELASSSSNNAATLSSSSAAALSSSAAAPAPKAGTMADTVASFARSGFSVDGGVAAVDADRDLHSELRGVIKAESAQQHEEWLAHRRELQEELREVAEAQRRGDTERRALQADVSKVSEAQRAHAQELQDFQGQGSRLHSELAGDLQARHLQREEDEQSQARLTAQLDQLASELHASVESQRKEIADVQHGMKTLGSDVQRGQLDEALQSELQAHDAALLDIGRRLEAPAPGAPGQERLISELGSALAAQQAELAEIRSQLAAGREADVHSRVEETLAPVTARLDDVERQSREAMADAQLGKEAGQRLAAELDLLRQAEAQAREAQLQAEQSVQSQVAESKELLEQQMRKVDHALADKAERERGTEAARQHQLEQERDMLLGSNQAALTKLEDAQAADRQRFSDELRAEREASRNDADATRNELEDKLLPLTQHLKDIEQQSREAVEHARAGEEEARRHCASELGQVRQLEARIAEAQQQAEHAAHHKVSEATDQLQQEMRSMGKAHADAMDQKQAGDSERWARHEQATQSHLEDAEERWQHIQEEAHSEWNRLAQELRSELEANESASAGVDAQIEERLRPMERRLEDVEQRCADAIARAHAGEEAAQSEFATELGTLRQLEAQALEAQWQKTEAAVRQHAAEASTQLQREVQESRSARDGEAERERGYVEGVCENWRTEEDAMLSRLAEVEEQRSQMEARAQEERDRFRDELRIESEAVRSQVEEAHAPMAKRLEDLERQLQLREEEEASAGEAKSKHQEELQKERDANKSMIKAMHHKMKESLAPMQEQLKSAESKYIADAARAQASEAEAHEQFVAELEALRQEVGAQTEEAHRRTEEAQVRTEEAMQSQVEEMKEHLRSQAPAQGTVKRDQPRRHEGERKRRAASEHVAVLRLAEAEEMQRRDKAEAQVEWRRFREELRAEREAEFRRHKLEMRKAMEWKVERHEMHLHAEQREIEWRAEMRMLKQQVAEGVLLQSPADPARSSSAGKKGGRPRSRIAEALQYSETSGGRRTAGSAGSSDNARGAGTDDLNSSMHEVDSHWKAMNQAYTEILSPPGGRHDPEGDAAGGTLPLLAKPSPGKPPSGKQKKRVHSHGPKVVKAHGIHRSASVHADLRAVGGEPTEEVAEGTPRTPPHEARQGQEVARRPLTPSESAPALLAEGELDVRYGECLTPTGKHRRSPLKVPREGTVSYKNVAHTYSKWLKPLT